MGRPPWNARAVSPPRGGRHPPGDAQGEEGGDPRRRLQRRDVRRRPPLAPPALQSKSGSGKSAGEQSPGEAMNGSGGGGGVLSPAGSAPVAALAVAAAEEESGRSSDTGAVYSLVNAVLGAGLLGFPFCYARCGLVLATLLVRACEGGLRGEGGAGGARSAGRVAKPANPPHLVHAHTPRPCRCW